VASPLTRFADAARTLGPGRALALAPSWLLRPEYVVFVGDLARPLPAIPPDPPLRWTIASEADLRVIRAVSPALSGREIRRRWREGQRCVISWYEGSPACWLWETEAPAWLPYLGLTFRPRAGDALIFDVFTAVRFRGRGIDRASSTAALHRARDRGCTRKVAFAAPWNAPVMRVTGARLGGAIVGSVGYWWLPPHRRFFARGAVRVADNALLHVL